MVLLLLILRLFPSRVRTGWQPLIQRMQPTMEDLATSEPPRAVEPLRSRLLQIALWFLVGFGPFAVANSLWVQEPFMKVPTPRRFVGQVCMLCSAHTHSLVFWFSWLFCICCLLHADCSSRFTFSLLYKRNSFITQTRAFFFFLLFCSSCFLKKNSIL